MENEVRVMYGWVCPRCGATNAPWMNQCNCHLTIGVSCGGMDKREKNTALPGCACDCGYGAENVPQSTATIEPVSAPRPMFTGPNGKQSAFEIIDAYLNRR